MALTVNTNIINDTDQYLLDAKNVKGSYVVVGSTTERDSLPAATTVTGSLCYCTGDSKFYQYNGTQWVEKTFGSTSNATTAASGLMSAADKAKLDGIAAEANKYVHPSTHAASMITGLSKVATSGSYNDLADKPTIPADTNQKVKTGSVTFGANDTVEFVAGSNVSISGDATNKKITISSTDSYSHPKYNSKTSGLYKITVDNGHVSETTAVVKADITALGIPAQDTTYSNATVDKDGLMSKTDKANLDTIVTSLSSDDSNSTIDTIKEVLKAFEDAPEGTNIINALAEKSDVGHNHEATTASVITGVSVSGSDTFVKTINGGSGNLTSDTTATNGIQYVESVTHSEASLTGTKTFNTDAIKDITLSASDATADGPKYVESITHTAATLSGTTSFNTDAIKSVTLSASDNSSEGPKYVESISGSAPSLTGDKTFVKAQGTLSGGSGSLEAYDAATNGTKKVSDGTRVPFVAGISNTGASASGTAKAGSETHTHTYDKTTGITLSVYDSYTTDRAVFVQGVDGGSGSLVAYDASTGGNAKTTNGNRVQYVHSLTKGDYTPAGSVTLTDGTAPSMGSATTKYLHFSAGTTPKSGATPNHTSTNSGSAGGGLASQNTGSTTPTFTGSEVTSGGSSAANTGNATGSSANQNTGSAGSTTIGSYSAGILTINNVADHTHTYTAPASHSHTITHTHKVTAAGTVGGHTHTYTKPEAHTHTYDKTTSVSLTDGTAPSLTSNTTSTGGIQYVHAQGTFSAGTTPKASAAFSGTKTNALVTGGTTYHLAHGHTAASATTKYLSAAPSNTSTATGSPSDTTAFVTGVTGGTTTATTYYLEHGHTAASLGAATTGTVGITGGSYAATTKYMKPTGTAASTGTVSISGGSVTPITKYMKKTVTAASTGTVGISGGSITPSTKYLHHAHTAASVSSTSSAVTSVASTGTVEAIIEIADAEN